MKQQKNPILAVLSYCTNDGILAEQWLDFVYLQNGRKPLDSILLVVAGDVHPELAARVRVAAEVAFANVSQLTVPPFMHQNKNLVVNHQFRAAAEHIQKTFRVPWLWIEPDAVPLKVGWLNGIACAYYNQMKRYSGSWLKAHNLFLARIAVYPPDAFNDLAGFCSEPNPFNWTGGDFIVPRSTKNYLVQEAYVEGAPVKEGAVMLHPDKQGVKIAELRDQLEAKTLDTNFTN